MEGTFILIVEAKQTFSSFFIDMELNQFIFTLNQGFILC